MGFFLGLLIVFSFIGYFVFLFIDALNELKQHRAVYNYIATRISNFLGFTYRAPIIRDYPVDKEIDKLVSIFVKVATSGNQKYFLTRDGSSSIMLCEHGLMLKFYSGHKDEPDMDEYAREGEVLITDPFNIDEIKSTSARRIEANIYEKGIKYNQAFRWNYRMPKRRTNDKMRAIFDTTLSIQTEKQKTREFIDAVTKQATTRTGGGMLE